MAETFCEALSALWVLSTLSNKSRNIFYSPFCKGLYLYAQQVKRPHPRFAGPYPQFDKKIKMGILLSFSMISDEPNSPLLAPPGAAAVKLPILSGNSSLTNDHYRIGL